MSSANIILNSGIAIIFMLFGSIALIVFSGKISAAASVMVLETESGTVSILPMLFTGLLMLLAGINTYTAASISLEGKELWVIRSLPVSAKDVLFAKIRWQLLITAPPLVLLSVIAGIVLKLSPFVWLTGTLAALAFVAFIAALGLRLNLKNPIFDWTNEAVPTKTGKPVMLITLPVMIGVPILMAMNAGISVVFALIGLGNLGMILQNILIAVVFGFFAWHETRWVGLQGAIIFDSYSA